MSQMRLKKMSQMRLKKMSQMRLKRPSYMRLRRGPSMMRLKKSPEEVDCVWVRGICIDSAEVELLNQVRYYDGANLFDIRMGGTHTEEVLGRSGKRDHSQY